MTKNKWVIISTFYANIEILDVQGVKSSEPPPFENIEKMILFPITTPTRDMLTKFVMVVIFYVDDSEEKEIHIVSRNFMDHYLNLLSFISMDPIFIDNLYAIKKEKEENVYRFVIFGKASPIQTPSTRIKLTSLFTNQLDMNLTKVFSWIRNGLMSVNPIDSTTSLFIALEILVNKYPHDEKIERTPCTNCGHVEFMDAGINHKVKKFLKEICKNSDDQIKKIWNKRNEISHGKYLRTIQEQNEFCHIRELLLEALMIGVKTKLGIPETEPPLGKKGFRFTDPILDLKKNDPTNVYLSLFTSNDIKPQVFKDIELRKMNALQQEEEKKEREHE